MISRPPPPVQFFIGYVTDTSLQIHWDHPENIQPPLTGYLLEYVNSNPSPGEINDGKEKWKSLEIGSLLTSFSLENLLCGTNYSLKMTAENSVGKGTSSPVVKAKTNGNPPEGSPRLTEILDGNGTMIRIDLNRWPDGGCPITNFNIEYRRDSSALSTTSGQQQQQWMRIYRKENGTRVFIFQTEPNSKYQIRIKLENDAGSVTKTFLVESHPGS